MSLYIVFKYGFRFWIAATPTGKRVVSRLEAEVIYNQMKAERTFA